MFAPKGAHLLGLLSYDDSVKVHTAPTDNLDVFEDVLDDMAPGGCECIPFCFHVKYSCVKSTILSQFTNKLYSLSDLCCYRISSFNCPT